MLLVGKSQDGGRRGGTLVVAVRWREGAGLCPLEGCDGAGDCGLWSEEKSQDCYAKNLPAQNGYSWESSRSCKRMVNEVDQ